MMKKENRTESWVGSILQEAKHAVVKRKVIQKEVLDVEKLNNLNITTSYEDVEIFVHDHPRIDIVLETYENGPLLTVNHVDETVDITVERPKDKRVFLFNITSSNQLQLTVPRNIADNWNISARSGDIAISHLIADSIDLEASSGDLNLSDIMVDKVNLKSSSGDVKIRKVYGEILGSATSGNITAEGVRGESLELKASSGDIHLKDIIVGDAKFKTSSGNIKSRHIQVEKVLANASSGGLKFHGFSGTMKGHTSSGSIDLTLTEDSAIDLDTGSGNITVAIEKEDLNAIVEISKQSGDIVTNLPMTVETSSKKGLKGILGEGKNPMRLSTRSGNVVLSIAKGRRF